MRFCGPDQLHGFEERLTTDTCPADFGWTPDWARFEERPGWYHTKDSVTQAGPCTRTNQVDWDDEVVFAALVGAGGLGVPAVRALNTVQVGMGVEAGLAIVVLAVILDRMTRIGRGGDPP
jgi:hypothetical protein